MLEPLKKNRQHVCFQGGLRRLGDAPYLSAVAGEDEGGNSFDAVAVRGAVIALLGPVERVEPDMVGGYARGVRYLEKVRNLPFAVTAPPAEENSNIYVLDHCFHQLYILAGDLGGVVSVLEGFIQGPVKDCAGYPSLVVWFLPLSNGGGASGPQCRSEEQDEERAEGFILRQHSTIFLLRILKSPLVTAQGAYRFPCIHLDPTFRGNHNL